MKIRVVSDLHLDFHREDGGKATLDAICQSPTDVLVLAGDLMEVRGGNDYCAAIAQLCRTFPHVVATAGNHEYYFSSPIKVQSVFDRLGSVIKNFHMLDGSSVEIDGQRFIGGALWFKSRPDDFKYRKMLADFKVIDDFEPWVYDTNRRHDQYLRDNVVKSDIVVTHHLPSYQSIAMQFIGQPLNRYFLHDMEDLIDESKPKLWVHGHSHSPHDYVFNGGTRVVCNPLGYPSERGTSFNPAKDIVI